MESFVLQYLGLKSRWVLCAVLTHERLIFKEDKEMDLVKALSSQYMKEELPEMRVGDTVRVHVRIKEGSRERIQVFEGRHPGCLFKESGLKDSRKHQSVFARCS